MNYSGIGKVGFQVRANTLLDGLPTTCLCCSGRFRIGPEAVAMTCGREVLGYICTNCLSPSAKRRLAETA
jgi:hypothetical protein